MWQLQSSEGLWICLMLCFFPLEINQAQFQMGHEISRVDHNVLLDKG